MSDLDFLSQEINELTPQQLTDNLQSELNQIIKEGNEKKQRVISHIKANNNYSIKQLVNKFSLDWNLEKEFGNSIAKVGFYTGKDQRTLIMSLHLPVSEWFRK